MSSLFLCILALVFICLLWREACRHFNFPWPAFLAWVLENPYMKKFANPHQIVKHTAVEPGMQVADIGCGAGRLTIPIANKVGDSGQVHAIDIQNSMLRKAMKKAAILNKTNIRFIHGDAAAHLTPSDQFDRVFLVTVLGEVPDRLKLLQQIKNSMKPGAVLSITEVLPDPCYQFRRRTDELCAIAGFKKLQLYGNFLSYTATYSF